jgi:topoisomerase-4 subunit A
MAYVKKLFNDNFLYYASYVIQDRAIPDIEDGLKPVQRRILHSLFEVDDGKYHKVANVVGNTMKYHPHGDASIYSALVVLANKGLFIDRQGNFGNIFTGDEASAARYIECRASSFAKDVFLNPKTTEYVDSYDGRNHEPVHFPAKLPVALMIGAEGIAVGMSTRILPHNPVEVVKAEIAFLQGKNFSLLPDFPTGGLADFSDYRDGNGKVLVRAKLDTSDPKRILITEIPFGLTTESLIESIEGAARSGQLKIASISDFTTENVEIEIKLARGVYTQEVMDALYAFTSCEQSISCNCLVIQDGKPVITSASEIVRHHAGRLLSFLRRELEIEEGELLDEIHSRTLERIFIEERVYKKIESMRTQETVVQAVRDGLKPFAAEIAKATGRLNVQDKPREITREDIDRLLKIQIRRISLYDIEKAKEELRRAETQLAEVRRELATLVDYAISSLRAFQKKLEPEWPRRTEAISFSKVDVKEAARRDMVVRYDGQTGYIGTAVASGDRVLEVSAFDRILVLRRNGIYSVVPVPEKLFVDKGLLWTAVAEKESVSLTTLSVVYNAADSGYPYIKRTKIEAWIIGKDYSLVPEGAQIVLFSTEADFEFELKYAPKPRCRKEAEVFRTKNYPVKGLKAGGVRLATREVLEAVSPAARMSPSGIVEPELDQAIEDNLPLARIAPVKQPKKSASKNRKEKKALAKGASVSKPASATASDDTPPPAEKSEDDKPELVEGQGLMARLKKKAGGK